MSRRSKRKHSPPQAATPPEPVQPAPPGKRAVIGVCVLLAALVCGVFGRTLWAGFVKYDDNIYVYENPLVTGGLGLKAVVHAFTHPDLYLWTPLATISHMLDCQVYGLQAGGHHLTNVLLHGAAVIALFLVLLRMTGALWRSAFVAAVFAIHPLHVESVAWVAERKDVLSGLFFMLTLGAYVFYLQRRSVARYAAVAALFALGLMAKPMLVTLPCLLLLLDYWPLGRFAHAGARGGPAFLRLTVEKLPLFALSAASCAVTLLSGKSLREVVPEAHPFLLRAGNALVCYFVYIFQTFWPAKLSVFYPFPEAVPAWEALGALALLAGISIAAFKWRGRHPALFTGWFWYVGMLAPVIGFVPVGREGHADRYTYLPQIGLAIALAWLCAEACARLRLPRVVPAAAMGAVVVALGVCAFIQTASWNSDESLWTHALEVMPDNAFAHKNLGLDFEASGDIRAAIAQYRAAIAIQPDYAEAYDDLGNALSESGDVEGAIAQYNESLQFNPDDPNTHNNLGHALLLNDEVDEAIDECQQALDIDPKFVEAMNNLGNALAANGEREDAIIEYRQAIAMKPDFANAHKNLANTLFRAGRLDEAVAEYDKALAIDPKLANAWFNRGRILLQQNKTEEALADFEKALQLQPHDPDVLNELAYVLATCPRAELRDGARAVELAREANLATGNRDPAMLGTLAAAYAETGQFPEAVDAARRALNNVSDPALADALQTQIALYQLHMPFREKSHTDASSGGH